MTLADPYSEGAVLPPALRRLFQRAEWMADAECRGVDPALFFLLPGAPYDVARAVCVRCPVRTECLEYALDNGERFGMWGATSERERAALRRSRRQAAS